MKKSFLVSIVLFSVFFIFHNSVVAIGVDEKMYNFCKKKFFLERIKELVDNEDADVNYRSMQGNTPLMRAALRGDDELVTYLLSKGADVTIQNLNKQTALHKAAQKGYLSIVKLLVKNKADVNKQDKDGNTPLHMAALKNHEKVAKYLVKRGALVTIKNKKERTPDRVRGRTKTTFFLATEAAKPHIK